MAENRPKIVFSECRQNQTQIFYDWGIKNNRGKYTDYICILALKETVDRAGFTIHIEKGGRSWVVGDKGYNDSWRKKENCRPDEYPSHTRLISSKNVPELMRLAKICYYQDKYEITRTKACNLSSFQY